MENEITIRSKLSRGTLCKIVVDGHPYVSIGDIVQYIHTNSMGYVFLTSDGMRLTISDDLDFQVVPFKDSLIDMIDFALSTHDKEWFDELVFRLKNESVKEE